MIFRKLIKYKILDYCLNNIFERLYLNLYSEPYKYNTGDIIKKVINQGENSFNSTIILMEREPKYNRHPDDDWIAYGFIRDDLSITRSGYLNIGIGKGITLIT